MSPLASHALLWSLVAIFVLVVLPLCRRAERLAHHYCAAPCCMPDLPHYAHEDETVRL